MTVSGYGIDWGRQQTDPNQIMSNPTSIKGGEGFNLGKMNQSGQIPSLGQNLATNGSFLPQMNGAGLDMSAFGQGGGQGMNGLKGLFGGLNLGSLAGWGEGLQALGAVGQYFNGRDMIDEGTRQFDISQEFAQKNFDEQKRIIDKREARMDRGRAALGFI